MYVLSQWRRPNRKDNQRNFTVACNKILIHLVRNNCYLCPEMKIYLMCQDLWYTTKALKVKIQFFVVVVLQYYDPFLLMKLGNYRRCSL